LPIFKHNLAADKKDTQASSIFHTMTSRKINYRYQNRKNE